MKGLTNALGNTELIIKVIADDGTLMNGQVVTVTKKETTTPDYNALDEYGVAIMDIDGKFYQTTSAWQAAGSPTPNGIAVSDDTHRFCIAKDIIRHICSTVSEADCEYYGGYDQVFYDLNIYSASTAINDFAGKSNTDELVSQIMISDGFFKKSPWSTAGLCKQFSFPNGVSGYLGAAGEWNLVQSSISKVNELINAIGGTVLDTTSYAYWTSTNTGDSTYALGWHFGNGGCGRSLKSGSCHVRAFSEIKLTTTEETKEYIVKNGMVSVPVEKGTEYVISVNDKEGYTTPLSVTYNTSTDTKHITLQYIYNPTVDLSMLDIYGNTIAQTTANCYVISKPGKYKFPMVYGNAIKNGEINYAAFTNNGGTYSHDFVNGMGGVITGPTTSTGSNTEIRPTGMNNHIVNSDCEDGVITDINEIWEVGEDGLYYYEFTVNEVPATGGNIIFQAYGNVNDMCIWTWHIWLWPHDLTPVEITNATGVKYNIMPVNLASKYDDDLVHIKNWFYQWGRMTPLLCPASYNSTSDHPSGSIVIADKASYLQYGISSPTHFYQNSTSPYNWFGTKSYYNLWDAACTDTGNSDNDTVKTVYDPCPIGFKMPNGNTFTGLSVISKADSIVKLTRYSGDPTGVKFPLSGYRSYSDSSLHDVGSYGFLWFSSVHSLNYAYYLYFNSSNVYPQDYNYRAYGFSVRPVQDSLTKKDIITFTFTINESNIGGSTVTYKAESGMTWEEWANSSYSNNKYRIYTYEEGGIEYRIVRCASNTNYSPSTSSTGSVNSGMSADNVITPKVYYVRLSSPL